MNNTLDELVSVIVPIFNAELYLAETLESLRNQTYRNWEAILVDDGSTDRSAEIAKEYLSKDIRFQYFYQENEGVSAARNTGLQRVKGNFFCFLDADDIYTPKSIEARLSCFQKDASLYFVDGKVEVCNHDLSRVIKVWHPHFVGQPLEELCKLTGSCFFGNTWMFKKRDSLIPPYFNRSLTHNEDLWYCIQSANLGGVYAYSDEIILKYRKNSGSAMGNLTSLESGYRSVGELLDQQAMIAPRLTKVFRKKAWSIMWKSYVGHGELIKGIRLFFRFSL